MVFKRLMQAMGVGGPSVETVLSNPNCRPGGYLEGQIHVQGGEHPVQIEYVALGLQTRVEVESGDSEYNTTREFHRQRATVDDRILGKLQSDLVHQGVIDFIALRRGRTRQR